MATEDDEKLARALQQQYENQAQKRSQRMPSRSRTPPARSADSGSLSGSEDGSTDGASSGRRPPRRGRRPNPVGHTKTPANDSNREPMNQRDRSSHRRSNQEAKKEDDAPVTADDSKIAKRLAEKEERRSRGEQSSHRRTTDFERSSHRRTTAEGKKAEAKNPQTTNDAEIARRLAEKEESRARGDQSSHRRTTGSERSSHRRTTAEGKKAEASNPQTTNGTEIAKRPAGKEEPRSRGEQSSHRRTTDFERSSHRRTTAEGKKAEASNPQTTNDVESARRLAGKEEHRASGEQSSHRRITDIERSSHHRATTEAKKAEAKNRQTTNDAELAKRLAGKEEPRARGEQSSHRRTTDFERSSHRRTTAEGKKAEASNPQTTNDAEIARRLAEKEEYSARGEQSSHRRATDIERSSHRRKTKPDTTNDAALARSLSQQEGLGSKSQAMPVEDTKFASSEVEGDEALARKLEQELKDEDLAIRMNGEETKRRRRTSYLARKKAAQRSKRNDGPATSGNQRSSRNASEPSETLAATDDSNHADRGRSSHSLGDRRSASSSRHRSKSRDSYDSDDIGSTQPLSQSRGRSSKSGNGSKSRSRSKSRSKSPMPMEQAPIRDLQEASDRDLAFKIDQETQDEVLARSINNRQARRISVYQVETADTTRGRNRWTCRRAMSLAIPIIVILAAVVGLAFAFSGGDGLPSFPGIPTFEDKDPFNGASPDDANRWRRDSGLDLEVLNALESQWNTNFDIAVSEWDVGAEALKLSIFDVDVDNGCDDVPGKLKVCNGDYGETKWRGINQVILSDGYIISSVAKLNEFYLAAADEAQRQYTMCHEIGHGFGLPHTDENFFNADLGNCMDYTSNPEVNKSPDETNFAFLLDLYGKIGGRRDLRSRRKDSGPRKDDELPEEQLNLRGRVKEAMDELENDEIFSTGKFQAKMLHSSDFSESVLIDLGGGYKLQVSKLLAL